MDSILLGAFDYCGLRAPRNLDVWFASLARDIRAQVEQIVDEIIEASVDGSAAMAAMEAGSLKLAPILLARRK